ncbi:Ger(x)C family spore germination protein [Paenibacillus hemerocallicola]|jgi:spore germination protein KC|uniref:Ger(X)C family spore germination protein n=1 Tax=Paenibacillus hemerocallicola TaxID=1172614 RepID=A0A5C4SV35_9BACL|nr:Ger(x)C family spore germination protein [Paenibacillus hemerocallicola]TNJ54790.1 Ger(x)C family spore germination protein [Paenibacillus hemerocallicola]
MDEDVVTIGNRANLMAALTCMMAILTGCWDRLEIEERAMILGVAIDKAQASEIEKPRNITFIGKNVPETDAPALRITIQLAVPGRIPLGPSEGGGGAKGGEKPVWVVSAVGHTIDDAFNVLQQEIAHRLFWGHLRVIVISDEVAKLGLMNINEYLRRNPEVRRTNWIAVSEGEAGEFMRVVPQLERVPILYLLGTMNDAVQMGKLPNVFAGTYWSATSSKGTDPYLPYVRMVRSGSFEMAGLAFFKSDRMVGRTEPLEIGAYMGIKNIKGGGYTALVQIPGTDTSVMYQVTLRKSRIDVAIRNGKPVIHVKIHNEGNLVEKSNEHVQLSDEVITKIERSLTENGPVNYRELIRKTQQKGSDIFGFGEYVRAKRPAYWNREIRTKEKWEEIYTEIDVNVQVTSSIRRVGSKTS